MTGSKVVTGALRGSSVSVGLVCLLFLACGERAQEAEFALQGEFGRAAEIYNRQCSVCHGAEGFGDGKAAYLLYPRPRDFSHGKFLLVSTDNRVPTDEDLFQTISRGMPGSAMPSWRHLPEQDRRDLVRYVRALTHRGKVLRLMGDERGNVGPGFEEVSAQPLSREEAEETATYLLEVGGVLELPSEAPSSEEVLARGREIYLGNCAKCHGDGGKGDGSEVMEDDLGFRAYPRDFTKGIFKGGVQPDQLAYRILGGMPGSAMPSTDFRTGEEMWATVHHVRSLFEPGAQEKVEQRRKQLPAERVTRPLLDDPSDAAWEDIKSTYVALMPLWWRDDRVEGVEVRAAHDGSNLAVHLTWQDSLQDDNPLHVTSFGDGAAVQFSSHEEPPFFGMGDETGAVNIWHWKAPWEADRQGFRDITSVYPRGVMDLEMSAKPFQPSGAPHAASKVEERDSAFYGGWGAGNLFSRPDRSSSVEDINAQGIGTIHGQAFDAQNVKGKGAWRDGVWRVVFLRPLEGEQDGDITFRAGETVRIAFAVWDGAAGDRNGQKSVTIWHDLALGE